MVGERERERKKKRTSREREREREREVGLDDFFSSLVEVARRR